MTDCDTYRVPTPNGRSAVTGRFNPAPTAGDTTPISDEAITRLIKAFYEAHGVESWESSAEYRYGAEHHWMREAFAEIAPLLVSAGSSAQAEPTHYGEAPDGMGWTKHRGLIGECSAPDCADDPDALNARLIAALDASESVVDGLRAELARTDDAISEAFDALRGMAQDIDISPVVRALEMPGSAARVAALQAATSGQALNVVFDGPPGPVSGRFIEVETDDGASVNAGEWSERPNGWWVLRIPAALRAAGGQEKP